MDNNNLNETPVYTDGAVEESKGLAIASLILGILSILCGGGIFGIVGLILAIVAKKKGQAGPHTIGLILSIVGLVLGLIVGIILGFIYGAVIISALSEYMFIMFII
ncbi:MAG: DUF4190 domain-containing protein [Lachnospiraceae bacterium]|nr:DUF4190 domain-containing protein [Lachnospiraceae bacterium]